MTQFLPTDTLPSRDPCLPSLLAYDFFGELLVSAS